MTTEPSLFDPPVNPVKVQAPSCVCGSRAIALQLLDNAMTYSCLMCEQTVQRRSHGAAIAA